MQHPFDFDPTYGYDLPALLALQPPEPAGDFADFWQATYAAASAVPLRLETRPSSFATSTHNVTEVYFDSLDGVRVGGWLVRHRGARVKRGAVVGHGYGGRAAPLLTADPKLQLDNSPDLVHLDVCARGFNLSKHPHLPDNAARHVIHGIERRETYLHRGCVADIWAAGEALAQLVPEVADAMSYHGGSFGGGIGALALPWCERFKSGALSVPSFGHHPVRLTCRCNGSGEAVRSYHRRHPEVVRVLQYFDAAVAARFIRVPMAFDCALFDPAVPPPGQFAVHNAVPGQKRLAVSPYGHFAPPPKA